MNFFRKSTLSRIMNSRLLSLVCLVMNLLVILMVFASLGKYEIYTFTNTDTLYLPSIWKDVMIDGTGTCSNFICLNNGIVFVVSTPLIGPRAEAHGNKY